MQGFRLLPWRATAPLGAVLGWFVGGVLRVRRRHVVASLQRAELEPANAVASGMYRSLGRGVFELLWMTARPRRALDDRVELSPEVRRRLAAPGGLVIATGHTGNWDLLACAAAAVRPLTVVTKRLSVGFLDVFWQSLRARRGVHLVSAGGAARPIARALVAGRAVAMIVDQAPMRARATSLVRFMNEPAEVDLAPALVAMRARAPLALIVSRRLANGGHRAELLGTFHPPSRPSRVWAEQTMREVTSLFERFVRHHPEQWLWMHRRWKRTAPEIQLTSDAAAWPTKRVA